MPQEYAPVGSASEAMLLGSSSRMQAVRDQIARLAVLPWPVGIEGPTCSGKRLAARMLHALSDRAGKAFVQCNINALPPGLELAELLGYTQGAFTGAVADHAGVFEQAHDGTLFLDELATASEQVQLALLQLIDERTTKRIGDVRVRTVNVRLVFASNLALGGAVVKGLFREDLYYRLGVLAVLLPALAEHREDIPELVTAFLERKARDAGLRAPGVRDQDMDRLLTFDWPGNGRQLEKVLEHYLAFGSLPDAILNGERVGEWRNRVEQSLEQHHGNQTAAARHLGISRQTLHRELKRRRA